MGLTNWFNGTTTTSTTDSNLTFAINSNWLSASSTWSISTAFGYGFGLGQQIEALDEVQVKSLKHILTLASASEDELTDIADSLTASTGDTPAETLKVLRAVRALVLLGQLTEKLAR